MAYKNASPHQTFIASGTIGKYKAVKLGTADDNVDLAGAGARVIGVTNDVGATANQALMVQIYGVAKVEAGGTISKGSYLKSDADGNAVATTTDQDDFFGIALQAAVDGDIFTVMLVPGGERSTA